MLQFSGWRSRGRGCELLVANIGLQLLDKSNDACVVVGALASRGQGSYERGSLLLLGGSDGELIGESTQSD